MSRTTGPSAGEDQGLDDLRTALLVGDPPPPTRTLPDRAARALAVARASGAPTIPSIDAAVAARDDLVQRRRALDVATAQARAVAVTLAAMPLIAVPGLGALLDLPLVDFYTSGAGPLVGAAGLALVAMGVMISLRMVRRAETVGDANVRSRVLPVSAAAVASGLLLGPPVGVLVGVGGWAWSRRRHREPAPPAGTDEVADLLATAVSGGLPPGAALRTVAGALPDRAAGLRAAALAIELGAPVTLPAGLERAAHVLVASVRTGAPAAPALRRIAADLRAAELSRAMAAAERLPAFLAFPTALCLMPACVLLVGAPLIAVGLDAAGTGGT